MLTLTGRVLCPMEFPVINPLCKSTVHQNMSLGKLPLAYACYDTLNFINLLPVGTYALVEEYVLKMSNDLLIGPFHSCILL